MSEIFLSYAREDKELAHSLWYELEGAGLDVWFDKVSLMPGQDWKLEIEKAIREAKIFLACLSSKSVTKRGFVQAELRRALEILDEIPEGGVYLIPIRFDDCEIPHRLRHLHCVDAFEDGAIPQLVSSITNRIQGDINYVGGIGAALKFVLIRTDAADLNWGEIPAHENPLLNNEHFLQFPETLKQEQFFKLVNFVYKADPIFDITLKSQANTPLILTHIGVQIAYTGHRFYAYGIPTVAKIKVTDSYVIKIPDIFRELQGDGIDDIPPQQIERDILIPIPDPIYFEGKAAYRYKLRLKDYTQHIPNHTLIRFIVVSDQGVSYSHLIRTQTW